MNSTHISFYLFTWPFIYFEWSTTAATQIHQQNVSGSEVPGPNGWCPDHRHRRLVLIRLNPALSHPFNQVGRPTLRRCAFLLICPHTAPPDRLIAFRDVRSCVETPHVGVCASGLWGVPTLWQFLRHLGLATPSVCSHLRYWNTHTFSKSVFGIAHFFFHLVSLLLAQIL
jgi:hypothetical protein